MKKRRRKRYAERGRIIITTIRGERNNRLRR